MIGAAGVGRRHVDAHAAARWLLAAVTAAGLAVDAYVHADLAGTYDAVKTSTISQGALFRVEAGAACLAAVLVLLRPRRYTAAFAAVVAAAGLAAVLVYRYVNVGKLGPLPSMYEPVWFPEKTRSAIAEAVATASGVALLVLIQLRIWHDEPARNPLSRKRRKP